MWLVKMISNETEKNEELIESNREELSLLSRMVLRNTTITQTETSVVASVMDDMLDIFAIDNVKREVMAALATSYPDHDVVIA